MSEERGGWFDPRIHDEWQAAEPAEDFTKVPDGNYQTRVDEVKFKESNNGTALLEWKFVILNGEHKGRALIKKDYVDPDNKEAFKKKIPYIMKDFATCGLNDMTLTEIQGSLEKVLDIFLEVTVKTSKPYMKDGEEKTYTNLFINRKFEGDPDEVDPVPF
jgi:hypothetical protein